MPKKKQGQTLFSSIGKANVIRFQLHGDAVRK